MWTRALTFVNAKVVSPSHVLATTLRVRRGRIDGIDVAPGKDDAVIDLDGAYVFPGLINAHDHLELNSQPRLKWRERYKNATEWFADFQPRFESDPALAVTKPATLAERVWVGGLKNLLAGVTTVCHHNPLHRPLLGRFPVKIVRQFGFSHSLHIDGHAVARSHRDTPRDWPWMIHAAEGIDASAKAEIDELHRLGCLDSNTVLIHGVAMGCAEHQRVLDAGAALIWCPTSNQFLFGSTADVRRFDDADKLALGSDSRLSGEGDLLDELRAAHATRQLSPEGLARAVGSTAARLLRLPVTGQIVVGASADLTVLRPVATDPFESLVSASRTDVRLTMIDGNPCVGEAMLKPAFDLIGVATLPATLDDTPRVMARWMARHVAGMTLQEPGFTVERVH